MTRTDRGRVAEPRVEVTRYTVSLFPADSPQRYLYDIAVEERTPGKWAVCWMRQCFGADGEWDVDYPAGRDAAWLELHRFDRDTALRLAKLAAPHVVAGDRTAAEAAEAEARRG